MGPIQLYAFYFAQGGAYARKPARAKEIETIVRTIAEQPGGATSLGAYTAVW